MKTKLYPSSLLLCLAVTCASAAAAEPVSVLGLALGDKMKIPTRECSLNELGGEARSLCWVSTPTRIMDGSRLGALNVPGADQRPKWAASSPFSVVLKKDGTLSSFTIRTSTASSFVEILNSISGRFGQTSRESKPGARISSAEWHRPEIHIGLLCSHGVGCDVSFVSAKAHAEHQRDLAARAAKDAARPASP